MHGILGSLKNPGLNELVERLSNLLHVVPHECSHLFVGQQCARVSMQKREQVEITAVPNYGNPSEYLLQLS
jgi:hypothetical protein